MYPYASQMKAEVVEARLNDKGSIRRKVEMSASDPKRLTPTIAKTAPVPTKDIVVKYRLELEDKLSESCNTHARNSVVE